MKWGIYYPLITLICFEIALLILGYRRYQTVDYKVEMSPEYAYQADDQLGISLKPGTYDITLNDSVEFNTTHTAFNRRHTPNDNVASNGTKIAFLGCSFTYGYGVNDSETFVAQLQRAHPSWQLDNYGIVGYGTVQSYLQLQKIIETGAANVVLLNFSSVHFMRNALTQTYRKNLKLGYAQSSESVNSIMTDAKFPFIDNCDCEPQYENWENMHNNWTGREYFASINWLQTFTEQYEDSKIDPVALTTCLLKKMNQLCIKSDISFGIVCLDSSSETKVLQKNVGEIPWIDVGFDFESTSLTLLPFDSHPNAKGHQFIANKIEPFLNQLTKDE